MQLKFKTIIIKSDGRIYPIDRVGPILKPFVLDLNTIYRIIIEGHDVYEFQPDGCTVKLTIENYNKGKVVVTPEDEQSSCCSRYIHPDGDGFKHLPKVGVGNGGKVLMSTDDEGVSIFKKLSIDDIKDIPDFNDFAKSKHNHDSATQEQDGFMSKEDKKKIDNLDETFDEVLSNNIDELVHYINKSNTKIKTSTVQTKLGDNLEEVIEKLDTESKTKYLNFYIQESTEKGIQPIQVYVPFDCIVKDIKIKSDKSSGSALLINNNNKICEPIKFDSDSSNIPIIINEQIYKETFLNISLDFEDEIKNVNIMVKVIKKD